MRWYVTQVLSGIILAMVLHQASQAQDMLAPGLPKRLFTDEDVGIGAVSSKIFCVYSNSNKNCSVVISIDGQIKTNTVDVVRKAIDEAIAIPANRGWSIAINSQGGDVEAAMAIGRLLRKSEAMITVSRTSTCTSACIFVLVGAVIREVSGRVGIHRPYFETPKQTVSRDAVKSAYDRNLQRIQAYLKEMRVSERLADRMMSIPPEKVQYLSKSELESYGVSEYDPIWKETIDLNEAQKYGLDRQEYARRRARAQQSCSDPVCYNRIMRHGQ